VQIADLPGARGSGRIPVSRAVLNRLIADALAGRTVPLKSVDVRPRDGDRFDAVITVTWPLVPALTASFVIVQQPSFPDAPVLVLRWSLLGAFGAIGARLAASMGRLPNGVVLEGDRLLLDVAALAATTPAAPLLGYVTALELHTSEDQAIIEAALAIPE
jgi:hypothetical protein